jgi:MFS family permease
VLYYATPILQRAGFPSAQGATQVAVLLGLFKLLMTLVAVFFVDKAGRRPLLLGGVGALTAALALLAALSSDPLPLGLSADVAALASAGSLFLFVGAYQVSFGPIAWLLVSEIFPAEIRTAAVGLATIVNFGSNFLVSLALPLLQEDLGPAGTYALFALLGGFALASIALTVPETKGRSLEEIQREIQGGTE